MDALTFEAEVIEWRGPAPFYYARIPEQASVEIAKVRRQASYGWGVIPVEAQIADVVFTTSLFPRDGGYLLPLKDKVRRAIGVVVGDRIAVSMLIGRMPREPDL